MFVKNGPNVTAQSTNGVQNRFIDTVVNMGFVDRAKLNGWESKSEGEIAKFLANGLCKPDQIAQAFSQYYGLPNVKIANKPIDKNLLNLISRENAVHFQMIPVGLTGNSLQIVLGDPTILQSEPPSCLNDLTQKGYAIVLNITSSDDIKWALDQYSNDDKDIKNTQDQPKPAQNQSKKSPFVDLAAIDIPNAVLMKFPKEVAEKYKMIVFDADPPINISTATKKIKVALLNPDDQQSINILEFIKKKNNLEIEKYKCDEKGLNKSLGDYSLPTSTSNNTSSVATQSADKINESEPSIQSKTEAKEETQKSTQDAEEIKKDIDERKEEVKEVKDAQLKNSDLSTEHKVEQMNQVAKTVLKSEEQRIKEGVAVPYNDAKPEELTDKSQPKIPEEIPEVKLDEIETKAGLVSGDIENENLEENNLDKFLSRPVNTVEDIESAIKSGMIPEIVAAMVSLAIGLHASDVHIEATPTNVRLRYRVDGMLKDIIRMPISLHAPLVSRIKILSKLKIDEQRVPQDGRFDVIIREKEVDLRVSTLPTVHGEKVVMRILDKSQGILSLEDMGMTGHGFDVVINAIKKPYGVILATGPTGSGKSTTLYAILQRISAPHVNVITLEDPVEYEIGGINQVQVKPQIGFTFAEGLRSVLRQDPNIVMVGEIRDLETASMTTHAALTGHLVLSTLHTNDAAGALPRLINMGVEPFLITSAMNCIIAQRLVRRVCPKCKEKVDLPSALKDEILEELSKITDTKISSIKKEDLQFYHGRGCLECTNGYKSRIGIYEVLEISDKIEEMAVAKEPASAIQTQAMKEGMITMKQDGILKALKGITTMDEVLRVTSSD